MTSHVNTVSRLATFILATQFLFNTARAEKTEEHEALRKIQIVQLPSEKLNLKFKSFKSEWITSEKDLRNLLKLICDRCTAF
jgi:hypothetical protein